MIKFWYPKQQRYDVYVGGVFIGAENSVGTGDSYDLEPPDDFYIPDMATAIHGSNFYDPRTGHLYLLIRGGANDPVE
ncbi:MAG: hypothetical protein ABGY11_04435, partial [Candidatus Thioglobus sp.]